jgi:hypothetical protein
MSCAVSFNLTARDLRAHLDVLGLATALAHQSGRPLRHSKLLPQLVARMGHGSARSDLIYLHSSADDGGAHWSTRSAETPRGALS